MISVTRLDGTPMLLNCDQIAWVERMPDTVISLMNGEKLIVRETPDALVERIQDFRRAVLSAPRRLSARAASGLRLAVSSERRS